MLDNTNRRLLRYLLENPENSNAELATQAGMSAANAARRIEKLTSTGVIKGQHAIINWRALGYSVEVSLRFTLDKTNSRAFDEFLSKARQVPEVVEIQTFLGRVDVRLSVISRDMVHYQEVYRTRILALPHIADIEALMHVATIKSANVLPL